MHNDEEGATMMSVKVMEIINELEKELGIEVRVEIVAHNVPTRREALAMTRKLQKMGFGKFHHKHTKGANWYSFGNISTPVGVTLFHEV